MNGSYLGSPLLVQQLDVLLEVVDVGHLSVVGRVSFRDRGVPDLRKLVIYKPRIQTCITLFG